MNTTILAKVFLVATPVSLLLGVLVEANGVRSSAVIALLALSVLSCTTAGVLIGRSAR